MLKLLLKKQMTEIFRAYFYDSKKNAARSKTSIICYIAMFAAIMVVILGGIFTALSVAMCGVLVEADVEWLYFAIMGLLAVLLGTFGSVFNTYSCLYLSKDNDLLLSMPVPVQALLASRVLSVYLMGLMYSLVVILPSIIVYCIVAQVTLGAILGSLLFIFLISVFVLTLSCSLGWVVAKISLKLKNKSIVTVAVSLAFIVGYYFFYFKAQSLLMDLLENAVAYGAQIKGAAYLLYLFGRVAVGDAFACAVISAVIIVLFIAMWLLISHSFIKTATSSGAVVKKIYKERATKRKGTGLALLSREFTYFTSNPTYMLNCGLGIVMLPLFGIVLLLKGETMLTALSQALGRNASFIPVMLCAAVCMVSTMNSMSAPSISLEGKSLWIIKSLPVSSQQILRAKLGLHLILTMIPALFCLACTMLVYPFSILELVLALLVPMAFVLFHALLGLFFGLKFPSLNWTSEIAPIKQSAAVALTLLGGFAYPVLMCVCFIFLGGQRLGFAGYMTVVGGVTIAFDCLLLKWLCGKGCQKFASL